MHVIKLQPISLEERVQLLLEVGILIAFGGGRFQLSPKYKDLALVLPKDLEEILSSD